MLNKEQQQQFNTLKDCADQILNNLDTMEKILVEHFPKEYSDAYQHWIPQIVTAIKTDNKWLPRGVMSFQDTASKILDKDIGSGIRKIV
jgi:hypothetical protein